MVTADTITDEQIRELRTKVAPLVDLNLDSHATWVEIVELCDAALGVAGLASSRCAYESEPCRDERCARCGIGIARAHCAEILNTRTKGDR